jgi:hypothetical protein
MEIADVRRRVLEAMDRAKRAAAERRARVDAAGKDYEVFLERVAVPIFRQVAQVLKAEGYAFTVFTPSGGVRLMSDRGSEDYIELALDTSGPEPQVIGHTSRARGRRVHETEQPVAGGRPAELTAEDVLGFVAKELEPFVEK